MNTAPYNTRTAAEYTATYFTATEYTLEATIERPTLEEAQAIAAEFPKSLRVRATTLSTYRFLTDEQDFRYHENFEVGLVRLTVDLRSTGTTGELNESGLKRWASFKRHAARLGLELEYRGNYGNSLTEEEARAL